MNDQRYGTVYIEMQSDANSGMSRFFEMAIGDFVVGAPNEWWNSEIHIRGELNLFCELVNCEIGFFSTSSALAHTPVYACSLSALIRASAE